MNDAKSSMNHGAEIAADHKEVFSSQLKLVELRRFDFPERIRVTIPAALSPRRIHLLAASSPVRSQSRPHHTWHHFQHSLRREPLSIVRTSTPYCPPRVDRSAAPDRLNHQLHRNAGARGAEWFMVVSTSPMKSMIHY